MHTSVFVGMSLEGFIARPDGRFDFLQSAEAGSHGYEEFMATVDALLIGRGTYEVVLSLGGWFYGTKPVFVLSSKPLPTAPKKAVVERMSGEPHEIVKQLEKRGLKHVYVDGGLTVQQFLEAGLIDRLIINRVPVLIGSGIPLFGPLTRDVRVKHIATRTLKGGGVQSEYHIGSVKGLKALW